MDNDNVLRARLLLFVTHKALSCVMLWHLNPIAKILLLLLQILLLSRSKCASNARLSILWGSYVLIIYHPSHHINRVLRIWCAQKGRSHALENNPHFYLPGAVTNDSALYVTMWLCYVYIRFCPTSSRMPLESVILMRAAYLSLHLRYLQTRISILRPASV